MSAVNVAQARRFAQEYVVGCNPTRAYIRAFGTKDENGEERTYVALRKAASKRLTRGNIKAEIAAAQEVLRKSCHIIAKKMVRQLASMATVDPVDFYEDDGTPKPLGAMPPMARKSILKIKTKHGEATGTTIIEYTLQDRYPAITALCKRLGITKDDAEWRGLSPRALQHFKRHASRILTLASQQRLTKTIQLVGTQASGPPSRLHIEPYDPP